MPFLTETELASLNFKSLGLNVRISDRAAIYNPELIEVGDHSRIDDFCVVSGRVSLGRNVHLAVFSNIAGGTEGVCLEDFCGLAYGCQVFSQSDDYSGETMTNPTVPTQFKNERRARVVLGRHSIVGANSVVFPGVEMGEGTAVGAMSVVTRSTDPWSIYVGNPAKRVKERRKDLLVLEQEYLRATDR
ncbi:MAG: acyltransferase [Pseudomonadota bacterium]